VPLGAVELAQVVDAFAHLLEPLRGRAVREADALRELPHGRTAGADAELEAAAAEDRERVAFPCSTQWRTQRARQHERADAKGIGCVCRHGQRGERREQLQAVGHQEGRVAELLDPAGGGDPLVGAAGRRRHDSEPKRSVTHLVPSQ